MAESQDKAAAEKMLAKATQLADALEQVGVDAGDLRRRLKAAGAERAAGNFHEAELLAEEAIVAGNALRRMVREAMGGKASSRGSGGEAELPGLRGAMTAEVRAQLEQLLQEIGRAHV